jgi:hypothetical protein
MNNPFLEEHDEQTLISNFQKQGGFLLFHFHRLNSEYQNRIRKGFSWKLHTLPLKSISQKPPDDNEPFSTPLYDFEFYNGFSSGIHLIRAIINPVCNFQDMNEYYKEREILLIFQYMRFQFRRIVQQFRDKRRELLPVYNTEDLYGEEFKKIPVKSIVWNRESFIIQYPISYYGKNVLRLWDDTLRRWILFTFNDLIGIFREKVIQYASRPRNPYTNLEFQEKQTIVIHQWLLERIHCISLTTPQDSLLVHYLKYPSMILYHYWTGLIHTRHQNVYNYRLFQTTFLSYIPTPIIIINPLMIHAIKNLLRVTHHHLREDTYIQTQELLILETYLKLLMCLKSEKISRRRNRSRLHRNHNRNDDEEDDDSFIIDIVPFYGLIPTKQIEYFLYELYLQDNSLQRVNEWIKKWYSIHSYVGKRYQTSSFLNMEKSFNVSLVSLISNSIEPIFDGESQSQTQEKNKSQTKRYKKEGGVIIYEDNDIENETSSGTGTGSENDNERLTEVDKDEFTETSQ